MQDNFLACLVLFPIIAGVLSLFVPGRLKGFFALAVSMLALVCAFSVFGKEATVKFAEIGFGVNFNFRLYHFSSFIVAAACGFTFLTALYGLPFFQKKPDQKQFFTYLLLTLGFTNGAVLADNLVVVLFFWESLLLLLLAMIAQTGTASAFRTAIKAFIIVGVADFCMMAGVAMTGWIAGTLTISQISLVPQGLAAVAFVLLVIGAVSKAGSMPFHTWIPDAAVDAPLPFMAYVPAAVEKLLGIYFLGRICLDLYKLEPGSGLSTLLMVVGIVTILFAVMMALVQKDYKRLLSYHAVSQVGYMVLGIGTALPVGIVGGIFHMINHALYKSCLFFTAGAVEKQAGTTALEKLGGLRQQMPITFACFVITAASISGVPPFNGFFSKELVYDAALSRGVVFYAAALLGSFLTAASFLKLGHAAFVGPVSEENKKVKEAPLPMLLTMCTIAGLCILFGVYNYLPLKFLITPIIGERAHGHHFWGFPENMTLVVLTVAVIVGAIMHHLFGVKRGGSGLKAAEHIYHAPGLEQVYAWQEKRYFDPYDVGLKIVNGLARILWLADRLVDWVYEGLVVNVSKKVSQSLREMHDGSYVTYILWSLFGAAAVVIFITH